MSREEKTIQFAVKATGITKNSEGQDVGRIDAYGAIFDNVDEGNDRILPGAFKRTIQNSKTRAKERDKDYVLKMLWQHKTEDVIGGWYELSEDATGLRCKGDVLLATQRGREYYELAKAGMVDEFSIIYDVMPQGAKYDKSGVRDLSELRLFSIDPVTFPMNESTFTVAVKSMEEKAVCGSTSGPIGPRDESWDGGKAKKQIWAAAEKEDGSINTSLAKKYFMNCDGDPQQKGSYGYPFWYVGDSPHICVGAVKAIAGAIQGSRGANAPSGLKAKVEKLYGRINSKYPDDDELTPPWKDDGKAMTITYEKKDFNDLYADALAADALEDWGDLVNALSGAMMQAFCIGDEPTSDMSTALDQFKEAVLKWSQDAIDCGMPDYLSEQYGDLNRMYGSPYVPYNMRVGSMSRRTKPATKAGRAISAANAGKIQDIHDALNDLADDHMKSARAHVKAVHSAADDLATVLQGSVPGYGTDQGTPEDGQQEGKARSSAKIPGTPPRSSQDTVEENDITLALTRLRAIKA